jgi:Flp pilus assembly protein TadG
MPAVSIFSRVRQTADRSADANQGSIAVIFAITALPIISFVGAAIDSNRANAARSAMQVTLDSTALMLSKDLVNGTISAEDVNAKAMAYFTALYTDNDANSVTVNAVYTAASGSSPANIKVDGSGKVTTAFMKVAGFPSLDINTSSTCNFAPAARTSSRR